MSEIEISEAEEGADEIIDPVAFLEQIAEVQDQLRGEFERLAGAVMPLLGKQYRDTEARMRVLETRLRTRQERPVIIRMANLLSDVRRIESAEDVKAHVEETILDILTGIGYQEMGARGDQFDPAFHEPLSGSAGVANVVTKVHRRGLACYGDVIIKAKVDVEPVPVPESEQGEPQP